MILPLGLVTYPPFGKCISQMEVCHSPILGHSESRTEPLNCRLQVAGGLSLTSDPKFGEDLVAPWF